MEKYKKSCSTKKNVSNSHLVFGFGRKMQPLPKSTHGQSLFFGGYYTPTKPTPWNDDHHWTMWIRVSLRRSECIWLDQEKIRKDRDNTSLFQHHGAYGIPIELAPKLHCKTIQTHDPEEHHDQQSSAEFNRSARWKSVKNAQQDTTSLPCPCRSVLEPAGVSWWGALMVPWVSKWWKKNIHRKKTKKHGDWGPNRKIHGRSVHSLVF